MDKQTLLEQFDKALRYHLLPFLTSVILQISEANIEAFDLVNEYCEDNELKYVGAKPRRKKQDKVILNTLVLKEGWTNAKIEQIAQEEKPSQARTELTQEILNGMDVQAAMRLLVFRWFDIDVVLGPNIGKLSEALNIQRNVFVAIKGALGILITDRNKGLPHFSKNSKMDEAEFKKKMSRISFVFSELGSLDPELCAEYEKTYHPAQVQPEPVKQPKKLNKKWIYGIGGVVVLLLIVLVSAKVINTINTIDNNTVFVQKEVLEIKEDEKKLQIKPSKIYFESNKLMMELWIGNGTEKPIQSAVISLQLQNNAGGKIVKLNDYRCAFSKEIKSGESTVIKIRIKANQVSNKDSDLSTNIGWWAEGHAE